MSDEHGKLTPVNACFTFVISLGSDMGSIFNASEHSHVNASSAAADNRSQSSINGSLFIFSNG